MKAYGIAIAEGANITNLAVATGTSFPSNPDEGELFFRTDTATTTKGLYCYIGGSWDRIASADSLTAPVGASLPGQANPGDLFYKNSNDGTEGLYAYNDSAWVAVSGATTSFTISGDVSGTIDGGTDTLTLATVNSNVGSFGNASSTISITVNAKGLVTAASAQQVNIDAAQVISGTFADARVAQSSVTQHQSALSLAASQTTSGTFADARISQSSVTQHQGALAIAESQITDSTLLSRNAGNETISGSWTFNNPIVSADPSAASHLTTKQYVDSVIAGLSWKNPVRVATTADITLSGTQTVDGAALAVGNRVLVKNQTAAADNGIYVVASGTWTRATDFDSVSPIDEINSGAVFVTGGNTYADTAWTQVLPVTTVGVDSMSFVQFSASGAFTAGNGLTLSGNTFNIGTVSTSRIVVNVDDIDLATVADGGGGSLLKFTRDGYGRVTGTSAVATGDLTGLLDSTYVNITGDTMSGALGIGASSAAGTSLNVSRNITGATVAYAILSNGTIQTDVTSQAYYHRSLHGTAPSTTIGTIAGFVASQGTIGAGSVVTNQYGFLVDSSLSGATNNMAFIGNLAAGTGRWNFYGNGAAQNYFLGNVGIGAGKSVPTTALDVNGAITAGTQTSTSGSTILRGFYNDGALATFGTEYANGGPVIGYAVTPSLAAAGAFVSSTGINATRSALTFEGHTLVFRNANASVVTTGSPVTLTERMRITAGGDVGIGVTPTAYGSNFVNLAVGSAAGGGIFDSIYAGTRAVSVFSTATEGRLDIFGASRVFNLYVNGAQRFSVDTSGNAGLGAGAIAGVRFGLDDGGQGIMVNFNSTHANGGYLRFQTSGTSIADIGTGAQIISGGPASTFGMNARTGNSLIFSTSQLERMRITSGGDVGIGTSAPGKRLALGNSTNAVEQIRFSTTLATFDIGPSASGIEFTTGNAQPYIFTNNGAERVRIDSAGNFMVGTAGGLNDSARLRVHAPSNQVAAEFYGAGASNTSKITLANDNNSGAIATIAGDMLFYANTRSTERMRIHSTGNIGIGTAATPGGRLRILGASQIPLVLDTNAGTVPSIIQYQVNSSAGWEIGMDNAAGSYSYLFSYGTFGTANARMAIRSDGLIGMGGNTTGVSGGLSHQLAINYAGGGSVYGIALKSATNVTNAVTFVNNADGVVGSITTGASTTAYNTTSDIRLKKNVAPAGSFGAIIDAIEVVQFDWKIDDAHERAGFVAQDLHTVVPEAVKTGDTDPITVTHTWGVDPSKLVAMLVKEIQELRARVAALENA